MTAHGATASVSARRLDGEPDYARSSRQSSEEIKALKARDNVTNWWHLARIYLVIAASVAGAVWVIESARAGDISWWWTVPSTIAAIFAIGASQHQFGGAIHEGTHYVLFANRKLNELASDWLGAFPIFTTTYHYRLHHLAHHQFVNDPLRDPDISQLHDSDHWLDFPITHVEMLWSLLKQLWLPNLFRYTIVRAKYSSLGGGSSNPYADPDRPGSVRPLRAGILFAVGAPLVVVPLSVMGYSLAVAIILPLMWAVVVGILWMLPDDAYPRTRLAPVIPLRMIGIHRVTYLALLYGALSAVQLAGWGDAWMYFGLLWVLALFTTFPLFMILRQWVQHGNADRGRYTNTRVFLVGPMMRYAVFPFGMDYHLPHHIMASVPHYKLKRLHELLLEEPEYRAKGVIVEGYFGDAENALGHPTAMGVLGEKYAPKTEEAVYVDNAAIEYADIADAAGIAREVEASLRKN
ncbi:fatty acid desaturase [Hyphomicrobium sp. NDB2Meth4]|uniref:fatty acid desaturase family protein n=1 Tax=Hyphomicrobium sp. NDB2Meth4 TaxID=1892846 RepID=UPI0009305D3A|nr:fatty acid desaturase [Hyphomicrobium sp. NDB2Meth4]